MLMIGRAGTPRFEIAAPAPESQPVRSPTQSGRPSIPLQRAAQKSPERSRRWSKATARTTTCGSGPYKGWSGLRRRPEESPTGSPGPERVDLARPWLWLGLATAGQLLHHSTHLEFLR